MIQNMLFTCLLAAAPVHISPISGKIYKYETCPESKDIKVLNMYNIFNLQKRHCE
jgi:hypothetical protein